MKIKICKGISKYTGLMFSKPKICVFELKDKKYVWHSFFVFYPIKIFFFNKNLKIVEKTKLRPFSIYKQKKKAFYAMEIPLFYKINKRKFEKIKKRMSNN